MAETQPWEFLIQLDGDRSWLPLETPTVEILEGRYRIVARSRYKNVPVEVRIVHTAIDEDPPKRRTQKRSLETNQDGLMVVAPFTSLEPGIWEFTCASGDLMPDLLGDDWKHSLQLHVLTKETEDWGWQNDEGSDSSESMIDGEFVQEPHTLEADAESPVAIAAAKPTSVEDLLHSIEQMSEQLADEVLQEYGLVDIHEESYDDEVIALPSLGDELPPLSIQLEQETYTVRRGQALTLAGQILSAEPDSPVMLNQAELRVLLRDPQTSETLLEGCEPLHNQALPSDLIYRLILPLNLETRLILGEMTLHDLTIAGSPVLASQPFTLVAEVSELLEAITQERIVAEDVLEGVSPVKPEVPPLNLTFLNFVETPKPEKVEGFIPSTSQPLPPQIRQPNSGAVKKKLDLPTFGIRAEDTEPQLEAQEPVPTQLEIPLTEALSNEENILLEQGAIVPSEKGPQDTFETLNLPDRFLDRLNSLAEDSELSEKLKVHADDVQDSSQSGDSSTITIDIEPEPDPTGTEFVVDDEPILPLADLIISKRQKAAEQRGDRALNPLLLPEDEPVPLPILELSETELVGGQTIAVKVKLPDILPKLYVKIWINDRQSRILLDTPRWITDFTPNGLGSLEATAQLTVPIGSVEIQVEAIAVEVMTDRESHKASVDRPVIPPDLPDSWSDELEA